MGKHRDTVYEPVAKVLDWECTKDCVEHGPFPTTWNVSSSQPRNGSVRYERYVAPYRLEYHDVKTSPPRPAPRKSRKGAR